MASITRNLAECYLFFYFLWPTMSPRSRKTRELSCSTFTTTPLARSSLGSSTNRATPRPRPRTLRSTTICVRKFKANAYLSGLTEKRQRELIRGEETPLRAARYGRAPNMDKTNFRFLYRLFSNHTTLVRWPSIAWPSMGVVWGAGIVTTPSTWPLRSISPTILCDGPRPTSLLSFQTRRRAVRR